MRAAFLTLAFILTSVVAAAEPRVYRGSAGELRFALPRVARGPVVDGVLSDSVWAEAAVLDSFVQRDPREGMRDTLGTRCLLLYDDHGLYVGFRCRDLPRAVRAPIQNRDDLGGDWVGVALDTYHDHRKSYLFISNPRGVQSDGVDQQGGDTDYSPDFLFTSKGRLSEDGYEVEMAIPFKSLRFPSRDTLTFGVEAARQVERENAMLFWAPITRDKPGFAEQLGTMHGLTGIRPGRNLSVIPSFTGTRSAERDGGPLAWNTRTRAGATFTLGVTSGVTANVAVTPDFSQVEADAGVIDVNRRFAIFFEEKRPFFLEGTEIFKTPINAVYTRRIADPLYGVKLTGKLAGTSLGVLQAADRGAREPPETLPDRVNPYRDRDAQFTIARFKQDVLHNSSVGLLLGERRQSETYDHDLGVDGTINFREHWTLSLQRIQSWARERDYRGAIAQLSPAEVADLDEDVLDRAGRITRGDATRAEISRNTRKLNAGAYALDLSPDFAADMGFIERTDQIDAGAWGELHVFPKGRSWFNSINPECSYSRIYDHDARRRPGRLTDEKLKFEIETDLPHNSWAGAGTGYTFTYFDGREFPAQKSCFVFAGSNRYEAVQVEGDLSLGDAVLFDETAPGRSLEWTGRVDLRLSERLHAGLSVAGEHLRRRESDTRFADVVIPRLRVSYQFTRELSLRSITELKAKREYDDAGALSERSRRLALDVLASYVVNPGTVFYLGYGSALEGEAYPALKATRSSAFLKLSYLWQM